MNEDKNSLSISNSILVGSVVIALSIFISGGGISGVSLGASGSPAKKSGPVEIVEYSDFQCPFCKKFYNEAYKDIKKNYVDTGKATIVYKHFPLSIHQNAQKASEASECARDQGKFLEYHDTLFTKGTSDGTGLNITDLKQYAVDLGLNTARFNACLDGGDNAALVKREMDEGLARGVSGTPTFYINGKQVVGAQPYSVFESAINQ